LPQYSKIPNQNHHATARGNHEIKYNGNIPVKKLFLLCFLMGCVLFARLTIFGEFDFSFHQLFVLPRIIIITFTHGTLKLNEVFRVFRFFRCFCHIYNKY